MKILRLLISIPILLVSVVLIIVGLAGMADHNNSPDDANAFGYYPVYGCVLIVIGFVIVLAFKKKCPYCRKTVDSKATVCGSCGQTLPTA